MDTKKLIPINNKLMASAEVALLTTIDNKGFPITRAMMNLRNSKQFPSLTKIFEQHENDLLIYFTTNTSSNKLKQIKANRAVSVYYCDPEQFHGLLLTGYMEIINDSELKKALWQDSWKQYYPEGYDDPDHTILCLLPNTARGWYKMSAFEFNINNNHII